MFAEAQGGDMGEYGFAMHAITDGAEIVESVWLAVFQRGVHLLAVPLGGHAKRDGGNGMAEQVYGRTGNGGTTSGPNPLRLSGAGRYGIP